MRTAIRSGLAALLIAASSPWNGTWAQERPAAEDSLELGRALHAQHRLDEALTMLFGATRQRPGDDEAWAWLADTMRRLGAQHAAITAARRALAIDPCNTFAHEVLATAYNPQYVPWAGASHDSATAHLDAAIACDPGDGNVWMGVWIDAMRRGDEEQRARALRELVRLEFLPKPWLTYARWVLETAPPNAVLLTNGDNDTYPAAAVQETFGVRQDVVVVNAGMLSLPWYARRMAERHGLPVPHPAFAEGSHAEGDSLLAYWRALASRGELERPLLIAFTIGDDENVRGPGSAVLAGPYWQVDAPDEVPLDTAAMWRALRAAEGLDWSGPLFAERDRSPVRRSGVVPAATVVTMLAVTMGHAAIELGGPTDGRPWLQWAERFATATGVAESDYLRPALDQLRGAVAVRRDPPDR